MPSRCATGGLVRATRPNAEHPPALGPRHLQEQLRNEGLNAVPVRSSGENRRDTCASTGAEWHNVLDSIPRAIPETVSAKWPLTAQPLLRWLTEDTFEPSNPIAEKDRLSFCQAHSARAADRCADAGFEAIFVTETRVFEAKLRPQVRLIIGAPDA